MMKDLSMRLMIVAVCLLVTTIQAQSLQGKWEIEQVTIEKSIDGIKDTSVYNSAAGVQSPVPCPQKLEINAQNIVLYYSNGWVDTSLFYSVESNQLTIQTTREQKYQYNTSAGILTLMTTYYYLNNLPTGQTEQINEKWTIILKNKP